MNVIEEIRFSKLKTIGKSPAHFLHAVTATEEERKRHLDIGSAAHAIVLGGRKVIAYEGKRDPRTKAYQAFLLEHPDELVLSLSEYDTVMGCADSLGRCADAIRLLTGEREKEIPPWHFLGRQCGGRPDVTGPTFVTELKTARTAHPSWFTRDGIRLAYHAQIAWYLHGLREGGGQHCDGFIVAVETTAPYVVTPMQLTARALEAGAKQWRIWFELLLACEDGNAFPPYVQEIADFDVPDLDDVELTYGDDPSDDEEAA